MGGDRLTKLSKYLSYHLRHAPQEIGLTLEPGGWVQISDLLWICVLSIGQQRLVDRSGSC
jgi:putative RNA 2'-phosphotransferase